MIGTMMMALSQFKMQESLGIEGVSGSTYIERYNYEIRAVFNQGTQTEAIFSAPDINDESGERVNNAGQILAEIPVANYSSASGSWQSVNVIEGEGFASGTRFGSPQYFEFSDVNNDLVPDIVISLNDEGIVASSDPDYLGREVNEFSTYGDENLFGFENDLLVIYGNSERSRFLSNYSISEFYTGSLGAYEPRLENE